MSFDAVSCYRFAGSGLVPHEPSRMAEAGDAPVSTRHGRLGRKYLRNGEMKRAERAFKRAIDADPDDIESYTALSALQLTRGKRAEARRTLKKGVETKPYTIQPCRRDPVARVLRFRGVQNAYYMLGKSSGGKYKKKLRGGNFSGRFLIDKDKFTVTQFFVLDENILRIDELPAFDLILNAIADPDVEAQSLRAVAEFIRRKPGIPVINRPDYVMKTTRDANYRRLEGVEGIHIPKTVRVAARSLVDGGADRFIADNGFSFPILVRETGTHSGRTFVKLETTRELADCAARSERPELYVTQFVQTWFAGDYYRKMRVLFIDGKIYPVVCHIDVEWNVHGHNRKRIMLNNGWMMDEERSFMSNCREYLGDKPYEALQRLYDLNPLDFFGIDFALPGDGSILVFELTAAMRHAFDHARAFKYLTPYMEDVTNAFNAMIANKAGVELPSTGPEAGSAQRIDSRIESADAVRLTDVGRRDLAG